MNKKSKIEKKFIVGTEGQADYLVVAEQAGHLLGIKPLILQAPNCTYVGVRVRSVFKAQDGDVVDESDVVSMTHKEAFAIDFDKQDQARASTMFLARVPRMIWQRDDMLAAVTDIDVGGKVARWVSQRVGDEHMVQPRAEIEEFVLDRLIEAINEIIKENNLLPTEPVDPLQTLLQPLQWQAKDAEGVDAVSQKAKAAGFTILNGGVGDDDEA